MLCYDKINKISVKKCDICHFWYMTKDNALSIMKNSDLNEKSELL